MMGRDQYLPSLFQTKYRWWPFFNPSMKGSNVLELNQREKVKDNREEEQSSYPRSVRRLIHINDCCPVALFDLILCLTKA